MAYNNATAAETTGESSTQAPPLAAIITPLLANRNSNIDMDLGSDSDDDNKPRELILQETLKITLPDKYSNNRKELDTFLL
jgi:hypothetical protein